MRDNYSTHYSYAQNTANLNDDAASAALQIKREFTTGKLIGYTPLLVYSGMSGIAYATAISLHLYKEFPDFYFDMAYVRKPKEDSHGRGVEYTMPSSVSKKRRVKRFVVFIDDCVDTGATHRRTIRKLKDEWNYPFTCTKGRKWGIILQDTGDGSILTERPY